MVKLAAYRAKRDFTATPEPSGGEEYGPAPGAAPAPGAGPAAEAGLAFVMQKHDASRLHYDLRLELDGVMKSWAVAKGPSLVPGEKRLSVHVEDHPMEYNSFEGTIPKGQYGGGTVLLWDRGRWIPNGDPHRGYRKGHLDFRLEGEKLTGAWHLVRMRARPGEKQEPWLLIKSDDEAARGPGDPDILEEAPLSVASGRDLPEIAAARDGAVWDSKEGLAADARRGKAGDEPIAERKPAVRATRRRKAETVADVAMPEPAKPPAGSTKAGKDAFPRSVEPCLATAVESAPSGPGWLHEIKWDGYRLIAFKSKAGVRLQTRRGLDWTKRFPGIAEAVAALPLDSAVLDGEAIVEGENGVASFSALQNALSDEHGQVARDAVLVAFDLLYVQGEDLRALPLETRKARLAEILPPGQSGFLRLGEHLDTDGPAMMRSARALGLEGIVSKRRDRPYRSGRGKDWVKAKTSDRQEFVVVGFLPSTASQKAVGSLALGYHEGERLRHAGRAGTGYTAAAARDLWTRLDPLRRKTSSVAGRLTAEERRGVVWVEPALVAEIEFRGWTGDDHLRHAAFKGLREDKEARDVVRERPEPILADAAPAGPVAAPSPPAKRPGVVRSRQGGKQVAGVTLTHPERVLWPADGITKQALAEFYEAIAGWVLPHLAGRPLSLVRCPGGLDGTCFFQKHAWAGLDGTVHRSTVVEDGKPEEILFLDGLPGLVTLVQASVLEIHPWGALASDVERPDLITMDLDPGEGVAFAAVMDAAREARERLSAAGLESFVKTTGGKGLHVVVPLTGSAGWPEVKDFAHRLADAMAADAPRRFLATASKADRKGRIYVDYLRNGRGATAVAAYSTRARAGATVSVPIAWEELTPSLRPADYTIATVPELLARRGADPWEALRGVKQELPAGPARKSTRRRRA